ncbi:MAG: hypothetical protein ACMG6S_10955 [Byssovorax sp.]
MVGLLALLSGLAGCFVPAESEGPRSEEVGEAPSKFDASLFKFSTMVHDDGSGLAGGWQRAFAVLNFVDTRGRIIFPNSWVCRLTVGMPIRAELAGIIPPENAAQMTANAAIVASEQVMKTRPTWIAALFCPEFARNMQKLLRAGKIPATVTST